MRGFQPKSRRENVAAPTTPAGGTSLATPRTHQLAAMEDRANQRPQVRETTQLQEKLNARNTTGMSDELKTGLEGLSGMDLSGVQVHYNSPKPAQLQAHAFTQGQDIHVAPGQERHVPHEGWHVVQQMQGRVQPTTQIAGTDVNDSPALETEADVMGAQAARGSAVQRKLATPPDPGPRAPVAQRVPRNKQAILGSINTFNNLSGFLESNGRLTLTRTNAAQWTVTPPAAPMWTLNLTFTGAGGHNVNAAGRVLTVDFDNPVINDDADQSIFANEAFQRIDDLIVQNILQQAVGGVFRAGSLDNDPANVNHIDEMNLTKLGELADQYRADYNNLNAAAPAAAVALRVTANTAFNRLEALVTRMGLTNPAKLAALNAQDEVDIDAASLKVIGSIARRQSYEAYEAAQGNLGNPGIVTHETVGHLVDPEERATVDQFRLLGIGGGHEDATLQAFVANSGGRYLLRQVTEQQVNIGGQQVTLRMYDQYIRDGHAWVKSNVRKSTADNINPMIYAGKRALGDWLQAGNPMPGHGVSFGRFSGNAAPEVRDAGTGLTFGGYGTTGLLSNQNELRTLFVSDEWFLNRMTEDLGNYMPNSDNRQQTTDFFGQQDAVRRQAVLAALAPQVTPGHADYNARITTMEERIAALDELRKTVSGVAGIIDGKLKSRRPDAKGFTTTLDLTALRNVDPALAQRFASFEQNIGVSGKTSTRLHQLVTGIRETSENLSQSITAAKRRRTALTGLTAQHQALLPPPAAPQQQGGWCYITTACMRSRGLPDDCEELTVLRRFRDEYLRRQEHGEELIRIYYEQAPGIVQAIHELEGADEIYEHLYGFIRHCVDEVLAGNNETALLRYIQMVLGLNHRFGNPMRFPDWLRIDENAGTAPALEAFTSHS